MEQRTVEREVTLPAPPPRVWEALTTPEELTGWLAADGRLDVRTGGDGWLRDRGELRHVVVEDVAAGRRLVLRWWPLDGDGVGAPTRVTFELDPVGGDDDEPAATRLVVVEAPVAPALPPSGGPVALAAALA